MACLSAHEAAALGVFVVPVRVFIDDEEFADDELEPGVLYGRLESAASFSSAAPGPGVFHDAYLAMAERGHEYLLAVTVSSRLTAVYDNARLGAAEVPIPVEIVDSRLVAGAQGLLVRRLAELAGTGAAADEVVAAAAVVREGIGLIAVVSTLDQLRRSGRVNRVLGYLGGRLHLKPLIELRDDGEAHPAGVATSVGAGVDRMLDRVSAACAGESARIVVMHALEDEAASALAARVEERLPDAEVGISPFTAVMGMYTGPGLLGIAWDAGSPSARPA